MLRSYFKSRYVMGAGTLATLFGVYQFAAQMGFVPPNILSLIRTLPVANGPPLPEDSNFDRSRFGQDQNGTATSGYGQSTPSTNPNQISGVNSPSTMQSNYQSTSNTSSPYGRSMGGQDITVHFSPSGGCTNTIVTEIQRAQRQIFVQAYSFTSAPIADALVAVHNRGVAVYVVLDKSQKTDQYSAADFLAYSNIPTFIDSEHQIAHNKIILIDGVTVITGSFNFSASAESNNAENLLVIRNRPNIYTPYEANFRLHYEHSQPYRGRDNDPRTSSRASISPQTSRGYATPQQNAGWGNNPYEQMSTPQGFSNPLQ